MKKNYGVVGAAVAAGAAGFTLGPMMILVLAIAIPIFIFGIGATIKAFQLIFSPITSGSIPIWVIFLIGLLVIIAKRRGWF